ncbi:MAG TPA: transcriptional regulator, TraR/DksA family protein [Desulfobacteraceae bacterium]|nr:transcriptional regulator, TraR/DksA family protein [Desulfobacteraceae bacterium]
MTQVATHSSSERYIPAKNEPYMSDGQISYFREKLTGRKAELKAKIAKIIRNIKTLENVQADILDRSNSYIGLELEVKSFERYSNMLDQVERALERIDEGSFGYCELTGSEIGLRRLEAIPFATMSIAALEEFESSQNPIYAPRRPLYS